MYKKVKIRKKYDMSKRLNNKTINNNSYRVCKDCGETKLVTLFLIQRNRCKDCDNEKQRKIYQQSEQKEKGKTRRIKWYKKNKKKILQKQKKWYWKEGGQKKVLERNQLPEVREKQNIAKRKRMANPEYRKKANAKVRKNISKKLNQDGVFRGMHNTRGYVKSFLGRVAKSLTLVKKEKYRSTGVLSGRLYKEENYKQYYNNFKKTIEQNSKGKIVFNLIKRTSGIKYIRIYKTKTFKDYKKGGYHLDHINPISYFEKEINKETDTDKRLELFIMGCNYRNLQIITERENLDKNDSIDETRLNRYLNWWKRNNVLLQKYVEEAKERLLLEREDWHKKTFPILFYNRNTYDGGENG